MTALLASRRPVLDWSSFRDARPRTVADVLAETGSSPTFLLDGLIHPAATLLTGPPKAGKSFLVVEWVEALTTGQSWHGRPVNAPTPVLVLPTDPGGPSEYARRFRADVQDYVGLRLPPRPGDLDAWARLADDAVRNGVGLVVLDNLYSYNPTAKINDNGEVGVTLADLGELARADVPYLVLHHTPKGGQAVYAGATNIAAHFRLLVRLHDGGRLDVGGNDATNYSLQLVHGPDGRTKAAATTEVQTGERKARQSAGRRQGREDRLRKAAAALAEMPDGLSGREQGRRLVGAVESVTTEHQGHYLVKEVRKQQAVSASTSG